MLFVRLTPVFYTEPLGALVIVPLGHTSGPKLQFVEYIHSGQALRLRSSSWKYRCDTITIL